MEYPKIHSLWKRQGFYLETGKKNAKAFISGDYAQPEFANIRWWRVEEKMDGTNIRIFYEDGKVRFEGRGSDSQIPTKLFAYLQDNFGEWNFKTVFPQLENEPYPRVILIGEGIGPKIQKNGEKYCSTPSFVLFDVKVGSWWLKREDIVAIAEKFVIRAVPDLGIMNQAKIIEFVRSNPNSVFNPEYGRMEGVVCKTDTVMKFRNGMPIMFKLRCEDFD